MIGARRWRIGGHDGWRIAARAWCASGVVVLVVAAGCDADDPDEAGDTVAADADVAASDEDPGSAPTTTGSVPSTTTSSTLPEPDPLADLPDEDPVTVEFRPGEMWPMSDIARHRGLRAFTATEEPRGSEMVRTVTYVLDSCDVLGSGGRSDVRRCEPVMIVEARFGSAEPASAVTEPTIPLTEDGTIWVRESTDPNEYPRCLETAGFCTTPVTLERRIGNVPIEVTLTRGFSESDMIDWTDTHVQWARSIYLYDETDLRNEIPWFRGEPYGPVVTTSDDGEIELRAQHDGEQITLWATGMEVGQVPEEPWSEDGTEDWPVRVGFEGRQLMYGITDPEVAEIVVEYSGRDIYSSSLIPVEEILRTTSGDLSGMFRHRFFVAPLPPNVSLYRGVLISARDADGEVLHRYRYVDWGGLDPVDEDEE